MGHDAARLRAGLGYAGYRRARAGRRLNRRPSEKERVAERWPFVCHQCSMRPRLDVEPLQVTTKLEALGLGQSVLAASARHLRGAGRQADPTSSSLAVYSDQVAQKSRAEANT